MYTGMYKMSRNEAFAVFAISVASVAVYSFWGAHVLRSQDTATSPQVVSVER